MISFQGFSGVKGQKGAQGVEDVVNFVGESVSMTRGSLFLRLWHLRTYVTNYVLF